MEVGRPRQTHCRRGHEFTPENSKVLNPGKYQKHRKTCRICFNMMMRMRYANNTAHRETKKKNAAKRRHIVRLKAELVSLGVAI